MSNLPFCAPQGIPSVTYKDCVFDQEAVAFLFQKSHLLLDFYQYDSAIYLATILHAESINHPY
jgi:hypothetical protein